MDYYMRQVLYFLYPYHHLKHSMTKTGSTSGAIEIILTVNYQILGTILRRGWGGGRGERVFNQTTELRKFVFSLNRQNDFVLQVSSFRVCFILIFSDFSPFFPVCINS